ncbi:DNA-directed RNA polymerase III subunit 1 [Cucumis melo var. makuwa]|uniref:DNA-directed RNA polymerase III subunit 1 n=1 Tax=Cucumis melo var. makuwa TaxID=1194695 RepID=A0A5A7T0T4_CUCMM|nr:DNA-directed RNA polymerase III subunit 1 [Cucumis melo var. makuwa]
MEKIRDAELYVDANVVKQAILVTPKLKLKHEHINVLDDRKLRVLPQDADRNKLHFNLHFLKNMLPGVVVKGIKTVGRAVIKEEKDKARNAKKFSLLVEGVIRSRDCDTINGIETTGGKVGNDGEKGPRWSNLTNWYQSRNLGNVRQSRAHKQLEERLKMTKKEVLGPKEMMLELKKVAERIAEDMNENNTSRRKDESYSSYGSTLKLKEKMDDTDTSIEMGMGTMDRSKYKKLEMSVFTEESPESWVSCAEHFFEINDLAEAEKVKVVVKFLNDSAPLPEMAESVLIDAFVTGLEPMLQAKVVSRHPKTLEACMKEAQLVNDRNLALKC